MAVGTLKTSTPSILSLDEIKRRLTPIKIAVVPLASAMGTTAILID